ncbi:11312_t:CDS:2, partial [Funneliformis geosporum]
MDYPEQLHIRRAVAYRNQCQYCINYLVSGIESNCKTFQKSVSSFNGMITDEYINKLNIIETETDDTNNDEDFIIDNNIDLQFERAINTLT